MSQLTPTTMRDIRLLESSQNNAPGKKNVPRIAKYSDKEPPKQGVIHAIRGSQRSIVPLQFQ